MDGDIDSSWGYLKVLAVDIFKGALLGSFGGAGVGTLSATAHEFGKQGKKGLKNK